MNKKALAAFTKQAVKSVKSEADLTDFIKKAPDQFKDAKYSAERERSVGLGVMGFHSFLQKNRI